MIKTKSQHLLETIKSYPLLFNRNLKFWGAYATSKKAQEKCCPSVLRGKSKKTRGLFPWDY